MGIIQLMYLRKQKKNKYKTYKSFLDNSFEIVWLSTNNMDAGELSLFSRLKVFKSNVLLLHSLQIAQTLRSDVVPCLLLA